MSRIRAEDPRRQWTPADLARRRSLTVARGELRAAEIRRDAHETVVAWRRVVIALEAEVGRP